MNNGKVLIRNNLIISVKSMKTTQAILGCLFCVAVGNILAADVSKVSTIILCHVKVSDILHT